MADINLNFNTDELDGLKRLLEELKKTAAQLKKLISDAGAVTDDDVLKAKRLSAEYAKAENELKKQELAAKRIADQQERVNKKQAESKGIIGGLESEVRRLRSALKSATDPKDVARLQAELKKIQGSLQKAKGTTASWGKALGSFQFKFNALGNIAANVVKKMTSQMTQFVREASRAAAQAEGIERAFREINQPGLLDELRKATRGTVSDLKLMQEAVRARNFKLPLEQLPKFFEAASRRAIESGESVDYLVQSIVLGVARKSIPILDNLGISATELREEIKLTGDVATAVGNIMERDLGKGARPLATSAELFAQAEATSENLKVQIGQIANLFAVKVLPVTQRFLDDMREVLKTQEMIQREVLDANILYQIEQDRAEVQALALSFKESGLEADKNQTLEQKAALALLTQYKSVLLSVESTDVKRIEQLSAQIKALERIAGLQDDGLSEKGIENIKILREELSLLQNQRLDASLSEVGAINREIKAVEDKIQKYLSAGEILPNVLTQPDFEVDLDSYLPDPVDFNSAYEDLKEGQLRTDKEYLTKRAKEHDAALDAELEKEKDKERQREEIINMSFSYSSGLINSLADITKSAKEKELSAVGDNAEKRAEIEREYARKEQALAIASAVVDGAQSILKTKANLGLPLAIPFMIADAAATAAQISIIKNQKFAKGEVDIDGPSHSRGGIAAEIEGGESVINKRSTTKYKALLEAINQDDQVRIMDAMSRDKKIIVNNTSDPYSRKLYELMKSKEVYGEDSKYYYKHKNGILYKTRK